MMHGHTWQQLILQNGHAFYSNTEKYATWLDTNVNPFTGHGAHMHLFYMTLQIKVKGLISYRTTQEDQNKTSDVLVPD